MRRPSFSLLAVRAWEAGRYCVPLLLLQGGFASRLPEALQLPWLLFVIATCLGFGYYVFIDLVTVRYRIDADGVEYQSGWPTRVRTQAGWTEVGAVRVDQDLAHRILGRFKVIIALGAENRQSIVIEAMRKPDVDALLAWHDRPQPPSHQAMPTPTTSEATPAVGSTGLLYRTSWSDHIVIAFTYGHFALVVPFLIGGYLELSDWVPVPGEESVLSWLTEHPVLAMCALVIVAFGYGMARSYLQFGDYRVRTTDNGYEVRMGILESTTRRAQINAVVGLRVDQNLAMVPLGLASLRLVLRNAHGDAQVLTVLPVATRSKIDEQIQRILPGSTAATDRPGWQLPATVVGGTAAIATLLAMSGHVIWAICAVVAGLVQANKWWSAWGVGEGTVTYRYGVMKTRRYLLRPEAVRSIESMCLIGSAWRYVKVTVLDSVARRLVAPQTSDERAQQLERLALSR